MTGTQSLRRAAAVLSASLLAIVPGAHMSAYASSGRIAGQLILSVRMEVSPACTVSVFQAGDADVHCSQATPFSGPQPDQPEPSADEPGRAENRNAPVKGMRLVEAQPNRLNVDF